MSGYEDPDEQKQIPESVSGIFDAFRARRRAERAADEPFPRPGGEEPTAAFTAAPGTDPGGYTAVREAGPGGAEVRSRAGRGRMRSMMILAIVATVVVGAGVGLFSALGGGSGSAAASGATPAVTVSASAAATRGGSRKPKGRLVLLRVTVMAVTGDTFTGTTALGESVTVRITPATRFGTLMRPFDRSALAPGAVVAVRGRVTGANGEVTAAVITGAFRGAGAQSPQTGSGA